MIKLREVYLIQIVWLWVIVSSRGLVVIINFLDSSKSSFRLDRSVLVLIRSYCVTSGVDILIAIKLGKMGEISPCTMWHAPISFHLLLIYQEERFSDLLFLRVCFTYNKILQKFFHLQLKHFNVIILQTDCWEIVWQVYINWIICLLRTSLLTFDASSCISNCMTSKKRRSIWNGRRSNLNNV